MSSKSCCSCGAIEKPTLLALVALADAADDTVVFLRQNYHHHTAKMGGLSARGERFYWDTRIEITI